MTRSASNTDETLTLEAYQALPEDDGYFDELSRGKLVREPRPGVRHQYIAFELAKTLDAFVRARGLGSIQLEVGFMLSTEPTVRAPDIAFIASERLPAEMPRSFWTFAPDLAIEIALPSNTTSALEKKVLEYLDAGTRMVWVIDPDARIARIYQGNEARILREDDLLDGGEVLPGFRIQVASVLV